MCLIVENLYLQTIMLVIIILIINKCHLIIFRLLLYFHQSEIYSQTAISKNKMYFSIEYLRKAAVQTLHYAFQLSLHLMLLKLEERLNQSLVLLCSI